MAFETKVQRTSEGGITSRFYLELTAFVRNGRTYSLIIILERKSHHCFDGSIIIVSVFSFKFKYLRVINLLQLCPLSLSALYSVSERAHTRGFVA
jgi:hypothetical protein